MKLTKNLAFDFKFEYSLTNYLTPTKITFVFHFKKLKIKKLRDLTLYTEFKNTIEAVFNESDFKIIQYKRLNKAIQIKFKYSLTSYDKSNPLTVKYRVRGLFRSPFANLRDKFEIHSDKVKEIISENSVIYIFCIEIIKRRYNIFDFGICKESRHLLIKYIKMLDLIPRSTSREMALHKKEYVYLEFGSDPSKKKSFVLKWFFSNIKDYDGIHSAIFLGKDKKKIPINDLWIWIPRQNELEQLIFKNRVDRVVEVIEKTKYNQWRKKHKISRKCEELNLLAYFMEQKYKLIWDKYYNKWAPKPPPPKDIFKINEYLTLKLEDDRTNIYVRRRLFTQCKYLLFSFTKDELSDYDEINSIDEIKEKYDHSHEGHWKKISPEAEFWGHCSNLQTWVEHDYDTRLLHSNISFPLLKELVKAGDPKAKRVFKEEIALRFESNFKSVVFYLLEENYLSYLDFNEIETLSDNIDFSIWTSIAVTDFLDQWNVKAITSEDRRKVSQIAWKQKDVYLKKLKKLKEIG